MTKEQFINHITKTFSFCLEIVNKKNADYSGNAEDPFKNFRMSVQVGVTPERGLLVRISDKISRISNLLDKEASVKDESISDSIDDAINYLAILKAKIYDNSLQSKGEEVRAVPDHYRDRYADGMPSEQ